MWNRENTIVDNMSSYVVAAEIMMDDSEPRIINECKGRHDWPKWEEAI